MLSILWIAPHIITGAVMWFIIYQMAPMGREFSLWYTIVGVVVMAFGEQETYALLHPHMGNWSLLAAFVVSVLIIMLFFRIRFWRALFAVFLYDVTFVAAFLLMLMVLRLVR